MAADPFDALGLAPTFDLTSSQVERAYLERVGRVHPDLAADASGPAADLNQARATLIDPMLRANALLRRHAGTPAETDKTLPQAFLAEIMEVREESERAIASGDRAAIEKWISWARDRRRQIIAEVARRFRDNPGTPPAAELSEIRRTLNAWRSIERMLEQLGGA